MVNVFLSYSHNDSSYLDEFEKHISLLKTKENLSFWCDRELQGGSFDFMSKIEIEHSKADIVYLFISANFLSSKACMNELKKSAEMVNKGIAIAVPIILSCCSWQDEPFLRNVIAIPNDGKEVDSHRPKAKAWKEISENVKLHYENFSLLETVKFTESFSNYLDSTELLAKTHSNINVLKLSDVYTYPLLQMFDEELNELDEVSAMEFQETVFKEKNIVLVGENQSGKTSLAKMLVKKLREMKLFPVYIDAADSEYAGKIQNKISDSIGAQYNNLDLSRISQKLIIPILDNFHFAKKAEKIVENLSGYERKILIVDDIFRLNFQQDSIIGTYKHFQIKEYPPTLRNELIKKWVGISETTPSTSQNNIYQRIDSHTELVDSALGKLIGNGVVPSYPFFILSFISSYNAFSKPLNEEITSQGYCYQALIYLYLTREGVSGEDFDTYLNFLTYLSYKLFQSLTAEIGEEEFEQYKLDYQERFNLTVSMNSLINMLLQTRILIINNACNYQFSYPYLYYFFVAKYFSENLSSDKTNSEIEDMVANLHKDENAYITIFLAHHSKDERILDSILYNAIELFDGFEPASLTKESLIFFDNQVDSIADSSIPKDRLIAEKVRSEKLKTKDHIERESGSNSSATQEFDETEGLLELRRAVKTVEVLGTLLKNRAGSLQKEKLEFVFKEALGVQFRFLSTFFRLIEDPNDQDLIVDYIGRKLNKYLDEEIKNGNLEDRNLEEYKNKVKKLSRTYFWNVNFLVIDSVLNKVINSLGSRKILSVINKCCDEIGSPLAMLVKFGVQMWYDKEIKVNEIEEKIQSEEFSEISKKLLRYMVVEHCRMHVVEGQVIRLIESKLKIPSKRILIDQAKNIHTRKK